MPANNDISSNIKYAGWLTAPGFEHANHQYLQHDFHRQSDANAENASSLIGTHNAFEDLQNVAITNHDDDAIMDDEYATGDYVTYTRDGTKYTDGPDASITYFATVTVTESDGTVHTIEVLVIQMPTVMCS